MLEYTGVIKRVRFQNAQKRFIIATFASEQENTPFTIVGHIAHVVMNERYRITGEFFMHPRYGKEFKLSSCELLIADEREPIIRYLSSSLFKGIGTKQAEKIVDRLGIHALSMIKKDPSCLNLVEGMTAKKIATISEVMKDQDQDQEVLAFFMGHGLSTQNLDLIQSCYKEKTLDVLQNNPYQLIDDIDGIGFKTADNIAFKLNFAPDHPYRLRAGVEYALMTYCFQSGSVYGAFDDIKRLSKRLLPMLDDATIEKEVDELIDDHRIIKEDDRYYPYRLYHSELTIASLFAKFSHMPQADIDEKRVDERISDVERDLSIHYDETQKKAIKSFLKEPALIITGGPGTGKTTIVRAILRVFRALYPDDRIDLAAPTGRAAKRLSELTRLEATTIHRLLRWDLNTNTFAYNASNPLATSLLVIDEFSMVDSELFASLLEACTKLKKILLIGDDEQLPSVAPGNVLHDMIKSGSVPVIRLKTIYRQEEGSGIVALAHQIRERQYDERLFKKYQDIHFISCPNYEVVWQVRDIVEQYLLEGYEDKDIQVLSPMYQGVAGINALNEALQDLMNPSDGFKKELQVGARTFREGDKVLQLKNRPDEDVFNGDIGRLIEIIPKDKTNGENRLICLFDDIVVEYHEKEFKNLTHAYCVSVHKSQGNEFPIVLMPVLADFHIMMRRDLLYTGLSRAKGVLYLLGSTEIFRQAVNREPAVRHTALASRLSSVQGLSLSAFE